MLTIILGILSLLLGIFLLAVSVIAIIGTKKQQKRCSATASGTVCRIDVTERSTKKTVIRSYLPVFEYEVGSQLYNQPASFPVPKPGFRQDDKVTVRYNPADPADFFVAEDKQSSAQGSITMLWIGALLLLGAMMAFFA